MKKLLIGLAVAIMAVGCATKTRNVEVDGMFTEAGAGLMAIGSVDVMASPTGEESAFIKYEENNAWLQPSMKLHDIKIMLTGSNSVDQVQGIVDNICTAFIVAKTNTVVEVVAPANTVVAE